MRESLKMVFKRFLVWPARHDFGNVTTLGIFYNFVKFINM